jgi:ferritin-like metal-binding protein YciE
LIEKVKKNPAMITTKIKAPEPTGLGLEWALNELFIDELRDIYWAEKHLIRALPKMAKAATSGELRLAIENHLIETENHVTRLESAFESIGEKVAAVKCEAMADLIKEGDEIIAETEKGSFTRDAGIISAVQKIEHYEIASYGTLKTLADVLGYAEAAALLDTTLQAEKNADNLLTLIAKRGIYQASGLEKK